MAHGSIVANSSQPSRRWLPIAAPASRKATISAWAVGSQSVRLRLPPRPTILPPHATTAPTGTSPASSARWAARRASSMKSSSELVSWLVGSMLVGSGFTPARFLVSRSGASVHLVLCQHRRQQREVRAQWLVHENIFSRAFGQKICGVRRQVGKGVFAEFFRDEDKHAVGTAPEGRELLIVQERGRNVGIVRSDFQVGAEASVIDPHVAMGVERNARAGIEIAILDDLVLGTQVGKDGVG